jgi:phage major head subunit gpT-like protein
MSYILDEVTSAVFINDFMQLPQTRGALFNIKPSNRRRERVSSFSGLDRFNSKAETVAADEDNVIQQFQTTFLHTAYAKTVPVARELIDDEDWGWFADLGTKLADSANQSMEEDGANVFVNSFTTTLAEDGLSLCNSAHLNVDSGNSQDNSGTTALSLAAVSTTRALMRRFTDYRGRRVRINPTLIICGPENEVTAWEIARSTLKPGGAQEDNFYRGMMDLVVWEYLTDTNDWWLADPMLMMRSLPWYMRSPLEVYGDGDLFTGTRRIGAYYRESHGPTDWRWVYGHLVA